MIESVYLTVLWWAGGALLTVAVLLMVFVAWAGFTRHGYSFFERRYLAGHGIAGMHPHAEIKDVRREGRFLVIDWVPPKWALKSHRTTTTFEYQRLQLADWRFARAVLGALYEDELNRLRSRT